MRNNGAVSAIDRLQSIGQFASEWAPDGTEGTINGALSPVSDTDGLICIRVTR